MNVPLKPPRPDHLPFNGLPDNPAMRRLRGYDQWVCWDYIWRPEKGKWDKPPLDPKTGRAGSSTNPATWASYAEAEARWATEDLAGVGFALSADDDMTGIDLDKCRNAETGELDAWAAEIVALSETYAEVSPSGRGIRLFAEGKVAATFKNDKAHVEVYAGGRYLTVTGKHLPSTPTTISPAPRTIEALRARVEGFMAEAKGQHSNEQQEARSNGGSGRFSALNSAALANLSAWVPTLLPAARESRTGYRVSSHDLNRDLEEQLSISPKGIVDFGVADMGDPHNGRRSPINLVMEYGAEVEIPNYSTPFGAAQWLAEQLGLDLSALGQDVAGDFDQVVHVQMPERTNEAMIPAIASDSLFQLLTLKDIFALPRPKFIVARHISESSLGFLYGAPGARKSFLALDWALHIAFGKSSWHGDTIDAKADGAVIYLTGGEGVGGMSQRAKAWMHHYRVDSADGARFHMVPVSIDFLNPNEVGKLVTTLQQQHVGPIALIVVDTISRAMPGADENLQKEMTLFIANCDRLKQGFECSVLGVHHASKTGNLRGSTVLLGAGDFCFSLVTGDTGLGVLTCEKQKDGVSGWTDYYRFDQIALQEGATSLVPVRVENIVETDKTSAAKAAKSEKAKAKLSDIAGAVYDAMGGETEMPIRPNWQLFAAKLSAAGLSNASNMSGVRDMISAHLVHGATIVRDDVSIIVNAERMGPGETAAWKVCVSKRTKLEALEQPT